MFLLDLLKLILNADICTDGITCVGSTFNAITASFATQGYYAQANFLEYLNQTTMSQFASLIYILCGAAGIVSFALGAPPKNYLWYFIGPAVYAWLVQSPVPMDGVRWMNRYAATPQQVAANQQEVWRLSETGLNNNHYVVRNGIGVSKDRAPSKPANVSLFFAWVDELTSDFVEQLVSISGVYELSGSGAANSNIDKNPGQVTRNWSILSDLKWAKIEDITAAKLRNGDLRDAFVTFLASECGDVFSGQIDDASWATAATGDARHVPSTIFTYNIGGGTASPVEQGAFDLERALKGQAIPIPDGLRNLVMNGEDVSKSFTESAPYIKDKVIPFFRNEQGGGITCDGYLWLLITAFRYEAGHIYFQLTSSAPGEFQDDPDAVLYSLLYGWGVGGDAKDRKHFIQDLILIHLFRNEFAIAPQPVDLRYANSKESKNYVDQFAKTINSKTKYAEVYSWALMLPYFQGLALYFLALSFPFAALMTIVPGWHKTIITWVSFWAWVKSWDVGFALVKVVERSIWAMIANNGNMQYLIDHVKEMARWGTITVNCASTSGAGTVAGKCIVPTITYDAARVTSGMTSLHDSLQIFGRALALAANVDLDLSNSYYIYIMAALYFAVPGITGQILLGAKAGASSILSGAIQGFSDKVSGAAQTGYSGQRVQAIQTNSGSLGQAAQAKAQRASGLAMEGLKESNRAIEEGQNASNASTAQNLIGGLRSATDVRSGFIKSAMAQPLQTSRNLGEAIKAPAASSGASGAAGDDDQAAGAPAGSKNSGSGTPLDKARKMQSNVNGVGGVVETWGQYQVTKDNAAAAGEYMAQSQGQIMKGFNASAAQGRAQNHGQRIDGFGNYNADMKGWEAKRNFGNQIAGTAAIDGLHAGGLAPGAKPSPNKDSAMSGILNTYSAPKRKSGEGAFSTPFGPQEGHDGVAMANFTANGNYYSGGAFHNKQGAMLPKFEAARDHLQNMGGEQVVRNINQMGNDSPVTGLVTGNWSQKFTEQAEKSK